MALTSKNTVIKQNYTSVFERDFQKASSFFPKLNYRWNSECNTWVITGELDICDVKGDYWDTFDIAVLVQESYPYCVPEVIERSAVIPRDINWHISDEGVCCIDVDNALLAMSRRGINIKDFISEKVYPYFANQLYKLSEDKYAGDEYQHQTDGVIQYYLDELKIPTPHVVTIFLKKILDKADLGRNKLCPCESGKKIKRCHLRAIEIIKSLGQQKLATDLKNITLNINDKSKFDL